MAMNFHKAFSLRKRFEIRFTVQLDRQPMSTPELGQTNTLPNASYTILQQ